MTKLKHYFIFYILLFFCLFSPVQAAFPAFQPQEGVYIVGLNSGDVLYEQNQDQHYHNASTTKLMTALILTENVKDLDQSVTVGNEVNDYTWVDSTAGLWEGEVLTYRDLLYALLLPSGNDAAGTIALNVGRIILDDPNADKATAQQAFVDAMNKKVKELGLRNTHFVNPDGKDDPNHYTSPADMAVIAKYAFDVDIIKQVAGTKNYSIKYPSGADKVLSNTNLLLYSLKSEYGGQGDTSIAGWTDVNPYKTDLVTAAKTGTTDSGDKTFVFYSEQPEEDIVGVIFQTDSNSIFSQSKAVLEELFNNYVSTEYSDKDGTYSTVSLENVHFRDDNKLTVAADEAIETYTTRDKAEGTDETIRWDESIITKNDDGSLSLNEDIKTGDKVGALILTNGSYQKTVPLYSTTDIRAKNFLDQIVENWYYILGGVLLIIVIITAVYLYRRHHKQTYGNRF